MPYLTLTEKSPATIKCWFSGLVQHPDRKRRPTWGDNFIQQTQDAKLQCTTN